MDEDKISNRIKFLLKDLGLSQSHLAHKLGIKVQYLNRLLISGASTSKYLSAIAQALDVTPEYLLTGNSKPVILVDDEHLRMLIRSKFILSEDEKTQTLNLLVKSDSTKVFFAYELKSPIDNIIKAGSVLVFSTNLPKKKLNDEIFIVSSKVAQSFIVGKYIAKQHALLNLHGQYSLQPNDLFIGQAIQVTFYLDVQDDQ